MKSLTGKVVSLANKQTAVVEVENHFQHRLYKKYLTRTKKYACQLEPDTKLVLGQEGEIVSCRPMSKTKRFMVKSTKQDSERKE